HDRALLASARGVSVRGHGPRAAGRRHRRAGHARRADRLGWSLRPDLSRAARDRDGDGDRSNRMIDRLPERSLVGNLVSLLRPWRVRVAFVALAVLAAAAFELLPPLVIQSGRASCRERVSGGAGGGRW